MGVRLSVFYCHCSRWFKDFRLFVKKLFLFSSILGPITTTCVIRPHITGREFFGCPDLCLSLNAAQQEPKKVRILGNTVTLNQMPEIYSRVKFHVTS